MKSPVLIIQTSTPGLGLAKSGLEKAGLIEGRDFLLFNDPTLVESHIIANEPQFLVTGLFNGDGNAATSFVWKMKQLNPELRVGGFSSGDTLGGAPYDLLLHKGVGVNFADDLVSAVKAFLAAE